MNVVKEELHYGLARISLRLGVGRNTARTWCENAVIRAYRDTTCPTAPWCCVESELNEDLKQLPKTLKLEKVKRKA